MWIQSEIYVFFKCVVENYPGNKALKPLILSYKNEHKPCWIHQGLLYPPIDMCDLFGTDKNAFKLINCMLVFYIPVISSYFIIFSAAKSSDIKRANKQHMPFNHDGCLPQKKRREQQSYKMSIMKINVLVHFMIRR